MAAPRKTILILGGTAEARGLAERLASWPDARVISSLAGRTKMPAAVKGETRIGGFGGAPGLASYVRAEKVDLVVDATHPFAAAITANAATASAGAGIACLRLERPAWRPLPGDDWHDVSEIAAAAAAIPAGARTLVTVGRQEVAHFLERTDIKLVARMIEPPEFEWPETAALILARPPFALEDEERLLREQAIDVLVTKNSGGTATVAKLMAARTLRLPVIMVARPETPPMPTAPDVEAMLDMIAEVLD